MLHPQFVGAVREACLDERTHGFAATPEGRRNDHCVNLDRFRFGRDGSEEPLLARLFGASNNGVRGHFVRQLAASNNGAQGFLIAGRDDVLVVRLDAATGEFVAVRLFAAIRGQPLFVAERAAQPLFAAERATQLTTEALHPDDRLNFFPGCSSSGRAPRGPDKHTSASTSTFSCARKPRRAVSPDERTHGFAAAPDDLCVDLDRVRLGRDEPEERLLVRLFAAANIGAQGLSIAGRADVLVVRLDATTGEFVAVRLFEAIRVQPLDTELAAFLTTEALVPNSGRVEAAAAGPRQAFVHAAAGARSRGLIPDALPVHPLRGGLQAARGPGLAMSCVNGGGLGLGLSPPSPATSTPGAPPAAAPSPSAPPAASTPGAPTAVAPSPSRSESTKTPQLNKKRKKWVCIRTKKAQITQKQFKRIRICTRNKNTQKNDITMLKFKGILESFIFFALPSMLVFYPTGVQVKDEAVTCQMIINGTSNVTNSNPRREEKVVVTVFAMFAIIWIAALLIATFGKGKRCISLVGGLTYVSVVSVVAFIVFALSKTMPETSIYTVIFGGYFAVLLFIVSYIWVRYVKVPNLRRAKIKMHKINLNLNLNNLQILLSTRIKWRKTEQEDQLNKPLLDDMV